MGVIWAIARNTLLMALRRKVTLVIAVFAIAGAAGLSFFVEGDNTLSGLIRVALTGGLRFASALLMGLMLYLSSTVLDAELSGKQVYLIDVKPAPRASLMLGKWLGLALLSAWLLILIGSLIYGGLFWLTRRPAEETERVRKMDLDKVYDQIFTSRRSLAPAPGDLDARVEEYRKRLRERGILDDEVGDDAARIFLQQAAGFRLVPIPYRETRTFDFEGLPAGQGSRFTLRYKLFGRRGRAPAELLRHRWTVSNPAGSAEVELDLQSRAGETSAFDQDPRLISSDGRLRVAITNASGPVDGLEAAKIIVPAKDGLELLVPAGSFEANFVRGLLLLWVRLLMIAAMGIAANAFLHRQVTAFFLIGVIAAGSLNSFVAGFVEPEVRSFEEVQAEVMSRQEDGGLRWAVGRLEAALPLLVRALPDFDETDAAPDLAGGREISWWRLLRQAFYDLGLRGGLLWAIGVTAFRRRELGLAALR